MNIGLYLHQTRRWALFIVLPAIVVAALGYFYTDSQAKTYQSSAQLFVQEATVAPGTGGISITPIDSTYLAETYSVMITDPVIIRSVAHELASSFPRHNLGQVLGLSSQNAATQSNTALIGVSDVNTSPQVAAFVAQAVANAFVSRVNYLLSQSYDQDINNWHGQMTAAYASIGRLNALLAAHRGNQSSMRQQISQDYSNISALRGYIGTATEQKAGSHTISVYSPAQVPTSPVGPHPTRSAVIFGFVALMLCTGGVFLFSYFDDALNHPEEVESIVGAPILGTIHKFNTKHLGSQLITAAQPRSPVSEAFRLVRTNVQFTNVDNPPVVIVVTSPSPKEGKSTTSGNLARVFAEAGHTVTIVDADLRRPSLQRMFQSDSPSGLTSTLVATEMDGVGSSVTDVPNLRVLTSGPVPPNPVDLLGSRRMRDLIARLRRENGFVIIDSPPALVVADAAVLSTMADGVILVVDVETTKRRDLQRTRESIEAVGGRILGVVINRLTRGGSGYYYYHSSAYAYQYGESGREASARRKEATSK